MTKRLNVACLGLGLNSTAMVVECVTRRVPIQHIVFADTGAEKPHTYKFLRTFNQWLKKKKYPQVQRVQTQNINGTYITLAQYCFDNKQLPSLAYGNKSCSDKHKIRPQRKFFNNQEDLKAEWKAGRKVVKLIGYDADEDWRAKPASSEDEPKFINYFPLIRWGIDREQCKEIIVQAGLPLPGKSACYFCPSTKKPEIVVLKKQYPELYKRALEMESRAELTKVKGLGRYFSWSDLDSKHPEIEQDCGCYDG